MSQQLGAFTRYTTKEHIGVLKAFPELMNGGLVFIKDTYEEASAAAALSAFRTLVLTGIDQPVRVYHHPHNENAEDPMDFIGSWGWKTA